MACHTLSAQNSLWHLVCVHTVLTIITVVFSISRPWVKASPCTLLLWCQASSISASSSTTHTVSSKMWLTCSSCKNVKVLTTQSGDKSQTYYAVGLAFERHLKGLHGLIKGPSDSPFNPIVPPFSPNSRVKDLVPSISSAEVQLFVTLSMQMVPSFWVPRISTVGFWLRLHCLQ